MQDKPVPTEVVHDDLWATVLYQRSLRQYIVAFDPDSQPAQTRYAFTLIGAESMALVDHYYDTDLNREVHVYQEAAPDA